MLLVQKWPFFQFFIFRLNRPRKRLLQYSRTKKSSIQSYKNKRFKESKNSHFSQRVNPCFWSKNGHSSNFFFLSNVGQENVFYDILEGKNAFLGYKNNKFKNSKNWHFSKGVNPWFWSKNGHFSNFFFLGNIGQENVFYDILKQKNAFLDYKNKKFKTSKKWHFSKGVNPWFWSNNCHFSKLFFFRQYRPGKHPLRYSETRKRLFRL